MHEWKPAAGAFLSVIELYLLVAFNKPFAVWVNHTFNCMTLTIVDSKQFEVYAQEHENENVRAHFPPTLTELSRVTLFWLHAAADWHDSPYQQTGMWCVQWTILYGDAWCFTIGRVGVPRGAKLRTNLRMESKNKANGFILTWSESFLSWYCGKIWKLR